MSYDIQDAYKLRVFMQQIADLLTRHPALDMFLDDVPEKLKESIEFIQTMVEKESE